MKYRLTIILFSTLFCVPSPSQAQVSSSPESLEVDGQTFKFGEDVTCEGRYLGDVFYGNGFARVEVLRINRQANLHALEFRMVSHSLDDYKRFKKKLTKGHFRFDGTIVSARLGGPDKICIFKVKTITSIKEIPLKPDDFEGRDVNFRGVAQPGDLPAVKFLQSGVTVELADAKNWRSSLAEKRLSVTGTLTKLDGKRWVVKNTKWKLADLKDQINKPVEIAGFLQSLNGHWWFNYGQDQVVLLSAQGPQLRFGSHAHGRRATVKGRLVKQLRPSLDQISLQSDRDLVPTFVVKNAKVQFDEEEKSWAEKFGYLPLSVNLSENGLPLIIPEAALRRNFIGNETSIELIYERNLNVISRILQHPPEKVKTELAKRIEDSTAKEEVKLLYAAILARLNDPVGRDYLLKALSRGGSEGEQVYQVYFALGIFPFLGATKPASKAKIDWVEPTLIQLLSGKQGVKAITYSSIPYVLAQTRTPQSKKALLEFALRSTKRKDHFFWPDAITRILCDPRMGLTEAELLRLTDAYQDSGIRRRLFQALIRLGSPKAVELYLASDEDDHYYSDLKSALKPEIRDQLAKALPKVKSTKKRHEIRIALCLTEEDPVPALIKLIDDPTFTNKNFIFYTLAPFQDARIVAPTLKLLKSAPNDYWEKSLAPFPLSSAIDALGQVGDRKAFDALIKLLPEKLDRFGDTDFIDREGWQRIIAGHLIELSGESFGTNAKEWQAWLDSNPDRTFTFKANSENLPEAPDGSIDFGR